MLKRPFSPRKVCPINLQSCHSGDGDDVFVTRPHFAFICVLQVMQTLHLETEDIPLITRDIGQWGLQGLVLPNPFRTKTPKYLFPRGNKPLFYHQIGNTIFFIFIILQISKIDVLCRQNKI